MLDGELRPRFRLATPWGTGEVRLALHGVQQVPNALAAAAAALWCGVPFDDVVAALGGGHRVAAAHGGAPRPGRPRPGRGLLQRQPGLDRGGAASLAALRAARKVALLGLMAELGAETEAEHRRIAAVGRGAGDRGRGLPDRPLRLGPGGRASTTPSRCCATLGPGDALLVKGSRVARLEDVVRAYGAEAGVQSLAAGA